MSKRKKKVLPLKLTEFLYAHLKKLGLLFKAIKLGLIRSGKFEFLSILI